MSNGKQYAFSGQQSRRLPRVVFIATDRYHFLSLSVLPVMQPDAETKEWSEVHCRQLCHRPIPVTSSAFSVLLTKRKSIWPSFCDLAWKVITLRTSNHLSNATTNNGCTIYLSCCAPSNIEERYGQGMWHVWEDRCTEGFGGEFLRPLWRRKRKRKKNIKTYLKEVGWKTWTGFIWLSKGTGSVVL